MDEEFLQYCRTLTDAQLAYVLGKEWEARRMDGYNAARAEAMRRGWTVIRGQRY